MDYSKKSVLVSGGTGSFGNFIVRRLLDLGAKEVRVLSRDEKKQHDMRVFYRDRTNISFVIGDVRGRDRLDEAMSGIDIMFHAAALKQVPACENFPDEAIQTNVSGAQNVVDAALRNKLEAFVMISTDKAVKPVNVMGMTKALQERIVLRGNLSRLNRGTRFACVRYGNVLRSRGSVIPLFRRLLASGKRLTLTDERMTRFLLTLNDAIDLVLDAAEHQRGDREEEGTDDAGPDARRDELAIDVERQRAHRLRLARERHHAELGGEARARFPGHQEGREDRRELGDERDRHHVRDELRLAELRQLERRPERYHHARKERRDADQRQRRERDPPELLDEVVAAHLR